MKSIRLITLIFVVIGCFLAFIGVLPVFQKTYAGGLSYTTWLFIIGYWLLPFVILWYSKIVESIEKSTISNISDQNNNNKI